MSDAKRRLGRGLDGLLPSAPAKPPGASTQGFLAPIEEVHPNRGQPRTRFDDAALDELAASIAEVGVLEPILVRKRAKGGYEIVAGERRWRAAQLAGLSSIPVVVLELNDQEVLECALVENLQRENLNPVEAARAYKALVDTFGLSQEEVADRVGLSRPAVANALRLLRLPADYLKDVEGGYLSAGHARALLSLEREQDRRRLRDAIVRGRLSVREAEQLAARLVDRTTAPKKKTSRSEEELDADLVRLREQLIEVLACRVQIKPLEKTRGRIEIHYDSLDELDRLLSVLGVEA